MYVYLCLRMYVYTGRSKWKHAVTRVLACISMFVYVHVCLYMCLRMYVYTGRSKWKHAVTRVLACERISGIISTEARVPGFFYVYFYFFRFFPWAFERISGIISPEARVLGSFFFPFFFVFFSLACERISVPARRVYQFSFNVSFTLSLRSLSTSLSMPL